MHHGPGPTFRWHQRGTTLSIFIALDMRVTSSAAFVKACGVISGSAGSRGYTEDTPRRPDRRRIERFRVERAQDLVHLRGAGGVQDI